MTRRSSAGHILPKSPMFLEYDPSKIDDSEIIKMAESAEVEK